MREDAVLFFRLEVETSSSPSLSHTHTHTYTHSLSIISLRDQFMTLKNFSLALDRRKIISHSVPKQNLEEKIRNYLRLSSHKQYKVFSLRVKTDTHDLGVILTDFDIIVLFQWKITSNRQVVFYIFTYLT